MENMASQTERMMDEWTSVQPAVDRFVRSFVAAEDLV